MIDRQSDVIRYLMKRVDHLTTENDQQAQLIQNYQKLHTWLSTKEWYQFRLAEIRKHVEQNINNINK